MIALLLLLAPSLASNPPELTPGPGSDPGPRIVQDSDRPPLAETTIGMRVRITALPLQGSLLQTKAVADPGRANAIARIVQSEAQGSGYLYDIEITPFVTGSHDLRDYLERVDGSSGADLPKLPITVTAVLPMGRLLPNDLGMKRPARIGGYKDRIMFAAILWVLGLILILYLGFSRKKAPLADKSAGPRTLAQRLKPLVEAVQRGEQSPRQRAELERLLLAYWRERKGLEGERISSAMAKLRADAEAGPLLVQLESWLHKPPGSEQTIDVGALLEPYSNVRDTHSENR